MKAHLLPALDSLFRGRIWVLHSLLIAAGMVFLAKGLNQVIAANLMAFTVVQSDLSAASPARTVTEDDGSAIADLFTRDGTDPPPAPPGPPPGHEPTPDQHGQVVYLVGNCVQANIDAILVGTMAETDPRWSLAIVQDQTQGRTVIVRSGDVVAGARVIRVSRNLLVVDVAGNEQCLAPNLAPMAVAPDDDQLAANEAGQSTPTDGEPTTPGAGELPQPSSAPDSFIHRVDARHYQIERQALHDALASPSQMRQAAPEISQHLDEHTGRPDGLRLGDIPRDSPLSSLGLRSGDVLTHVNGNHVTTVQRGMALYNALLEESHVEVTVARRGRDVTIVYDIQ